MPQDIMAAREGTDERKKARFLVSSWVEKLTFGTGECEQRPG
jgi:hypothetical protein